MEKLLLSNENIAAAVEELTAFYKKHKTEKHIVLSNTLAVEEMLLQFKDHFGENAEFSLTCSKRLGSLHARISVKGEAFNPIAASENEDDECYLLITKRLDMAPVYKYEHGTNVIDFPTEKHNNSAVMKLVLSITLSIVCALLTQLLPEPARTFIPEEVISPLVDLFSTFFKSISGPVIFFTVMTSIINMGDLTSLRTFGRKVLRKIFLLSLVFMIISLVIPILMTGVQFSGSNSSSYIVIRDTLIDIVPTNIISPFQDGSVLQILFWGVIIATGLLAVSNQDSAVARGLIVFNKAFNKIMSAVASLLPFFIFCSLYLFVLGNSEDLLAAGKMLEYYAISEGILMILIFASAWAASGVSPRKIFKYSYKSVFLGAMTQNSLLPLPDEMEDLSDNDKYGLDERQVRFVTPLSQIMFRPVISVWFACIILGIISMEGTFISVSTLFTMILICFVFSVAVPAGSGGSMAIIAILFKTCNINMGYLALAITIDTLSDYITTGLIVIETISGTLLCAGKKQQ